MELRLINANWRTGDQPSATRLLNYAQDDKLPAFLRRRRPACLGGMEGAWRGRSGSWPWFVRSMPVPGPTSKPWSKGACQDWSPECVWTSSPRCNAWRSRWATPSGAGLARMDPRSAAGRWLDWKRSAPGAPRNASTLPGVLSSLLIDEDDKVRALAAKLLVEVARRVGTEAALAMTGSKSVNDRQQALLILGDIPVEKAVKALGDRLEAATRKEAPVDTLFELLKAAAKHPALAGKLADYQKSLDPANPMDPYRECLEGGDPVQGADYFANHAAGQCNKCHMVGNSGGIRRAQSFGPWPEAGSPLHPRIPRQPVRSGCPRLTG